MRSVKFALHRPGLILGLALGLLVAVIGAYGKFGNGVEFFPKVEPDYGQVVIHGRGNLSLDEKDRLVRAVEERVLKYPGLRTVYTRSGGSIPVVGTFQKFLKAPSVMMGFGLPDDNLHAPNEKFNLKNFSLGIESLIRFLEELGG